jgi:hypothetical protein
MITLQLTIDELRELVQAQENTMVVPGIRYYDASKRSSWVKGLQYYPEDRLIIISLENDSYNFYNCCATEYCDLIEAPSIGSAVSSFFKSRNHPQSGYKD